MKKTDLPIIDDSYVGYTGSSDDNLGINQGDTIARVLNQLVLSLSALVDKVNSCSFCEGEDNSLSFSASNITTTNSNISQNSTITTSNTASIKTTPSPIGVNVEFNLNDVIDNLGPNTNVVKTKTTIVGQKNGYPSNLVNSDKSSATVMLKPDNFPAYIETELRYMDSTGEKTVSLKVPVSNTASEINLPLQGGLSGSPIINNQEDLNSNHQDRILNLENMVRSLNTLNITGSNTSLPTGSNVSQAIAYIVSEIDAIKASLP